MSNQSHQYRWSGGAQLFSPKVDGRRWIESLPCSGDGSITDVPITHDIRSWISSPQNWEIRLVLRALFERGMPSGNAPGSRDRQAYECWRYLNDKVCYSRESKLLHSNGASDIWQFPAETLATGRGDCEDCSFLLATIMTACGIPDDNIRVVIGSLVREDQPAEAHAWVIYLDEGGTWRLLESTGTAVAMADAPTATAMAQPDSMDSNNLMRRYIPTICFNRQYAWSLEPEIVEWSHTLYEAL